MVSSPSSTFDPANELQRSGELLVRHWRLGLPMAIFSALTVLVVFATIVAAVLSIWTTPTGYGNSVPAPSLIGFLTNVGFGAVFVGFGFAFAGLLTLCASEDVLLDRPIDWRAAVAATLARFAQFLLLIAILAAIGIVLLPFCVILVGIPALLAVWYFSMYATAAVALGGENAFAAIRTSVRIARTRVTESVVAWLGIVAAFVLGSIANGVLGHIPIVNAIAAFVIGGFTAAFSELVRARFYLTLRVPGAASTVQPDAYVAPPSV